MIKQQDEMGKKGIKERVYYFNREINYLDVVIG